MTHFLANDQNPTGYKLEDILAIIRADILKRAMVTICERMREARVESRMLLTVHDELIFEVPRTEQESMTTLVRTAMEGAIALEVPLLVEVGCGPNWGAAH